MAKPLRSQLNQVRAWVRQGRTDAWIAHQLEVSTSELREFRRRHELSADDEGEGDETDLRDEIEAEIEAATREEELAAEEAGEDSTDGGSDANIDEDDGDADGDDGGSDTSATPAPKRRRRRRGGRGRSGGRPGVSMQASFDHGDEGYGLWLDAAIADDPIYAEHWAGHRPVEVTVEPDRIVIRRSGDDSNGNGKSDENGSDSDQD